MDVAALRHGARGFLAMATAGGFGPPAARGVGRRAPARACRCHLTRPSRRLALAAAGGQRAAYDNRASLDEWNLRASSVSAAVCPGWRSSSAPGGAVLRNSRQPDTVSPVRSGTRADCLSGRIGSRRAVVAGELVGGRRRIHLPAHAGQLARLRP